MWIMKKRMIIVTVIAAAVIAAAMALYFALKPGGIVAERIEAVPENKYTENITMPEYGTPEYVLDNSKDGSYAIFYKDITREQSEEYLEKLKAEGFETVENDTDTASMGTVLKKDNTTLSISISRDILGIYITTK